MGLAGGLSKVFNKHKSLLIKAPRHLHVHEIISVFVLSVSMAEGKKDHEQKFPRSVGESQNGTQLRAQST